MGRRAQIALASVVGILLVAGGCRVRDRSRELGQDRRRGPDRRRERRRHVLRPGQVAAAREAGEAARQAGHGDLRGDEVRAEPGPAAGARRRQRHGRRRARREPSGRLPHARVALHDRGLGRSRDHSARSPTRPTRSTSSSTRSPRRSTRPATDATVSPAPDSLNAVPGKDGVSLVSDKLASELRGAIESPRRPDRLGAGEEGQAAGHDRSARPEVPDLPHDRPRQLPAAPVEEPEARPRPTRSRSASTASRRPPALHDRRQAGEPVLARARLGLGREPRRAGHPAGAGRPDQGAVDGFLQRRRDPRHR